MNWVFSGILISTLLELFFCNSINWFWIPFIIVIIDRALVFARMLGSNTKTKTVVALEGFSLVFLVICNMISKKPTDWLLVILFLLFNLVVSVLTVVDEAFYVYVEEDDNGHMYRN